MAFLSDLPLPVMLAALALLGAVVGSFVNAAIYGFAWDEKRRRIGPWARRENGVLDRRSTDFVPILGWWSLRREASLHGSRFWIRPALIEVAWAVALPWLFWRYVEQGHAFPERLLPLTSDLLPWGLTLFAFHAGLLAALCAATFIDFDEQIIPDQITVVGTLIALALSPFVYVHPPIATVASVAGPDAVPLFASRPLNWPSSFESGWGLGYALAAFGIWCLALIPWLRPQVLFRTLGRSPSRAARWFVAAPLREGARPLTFLCLGVLIVGCAAVVGVYWRGGTAWQGLLTSLLGLAFGGGLIWAIRIVASTAIGKEAMGFGDVTLMAMIGAALGWQPTLVTFFLAPFAALGIAVVQFAITRRNDIAFGPYLSLGAAIAAIWWAPIWEEWAGELFRMGVFIPQAVGACVILMGAMLFVWRLVKRYALGIDGGYRESDDERADG
ncbi:MAG TPA: A24 family peptidase [Pirellulaceae bacterium]|nr:A24 family peptidase [Pirellulaceae bacterium]